MVEPTEFPASGEPAQAPAGEGLRGHDQQTDADLVRRVAAGDRAAFAALYDAYGTRAYSLARRLCVAPELAEDVVQEAFLGFWRNPARFDPERGTFATWLLTMVHHRAVDAIRREDAQRKRADASADTAVEIAPGADVEALTGVEGGQVRSALRTLSEDQRTIISLAYFGGYTQNEVATLTGLPLGTVKSRTFTALRKLRSSLSSLRVAEEGVNP